MRDWPYVKMALRELWPVAVLGLVGAVGVLAFVTFEATTLAFSVVALAGLWGGTIAGGGTTRKMLHLLVRPIDRDRLLACRVAVLVAMLGVVVLGLSTAMHYDGDAYPAWAMLFGVCVCTFAGVVTGAATENETSAVGIGLLAATAVLVPPVMFASALDLTWARIENALGWLRWPFTIALVATAVLPMMHAWRTVPQRSRIWRLRLGMRGLAVAVLHFALAWAPAAVIAAGPVAGEPIGAFEGPAGTYILATGSRFDKSSDAIADGVVVVEGDTRREIFDASILHSLTGGRSGSIDRVDTSPSAEHIAVTLRESDAERRVLVVHTTTADVVDLGGKLVPTIAWSIDGSHLLVQGSNVEVYRVGSDVELVSKHSCDRGRPSFDRLPQHAAAWADRITPRCDAPLDLGGGWIGGRPMWIEHGLPLQVQSFDPRDRLVHSAPVDLPESAHAVGQLDDRHLAVTAAPEVRGVAIQRVWIIDRDGGVVARIALADKWTPRKVFGPPGGPWLMQDGYGRVTAWASDGQLLWREAYAASRLGELPIAIGDETVIGIGRDAQIWEHPLPWIGGAP